MFNLLVAGGRDFNDYTLCASTLDRLLTSKRQTDDIVIISGMARGADTLAVRYAKEHNYALVKCPADWDTHGRSAGFIRNKQMVTLADAVVCFWDKRSKGTASTIQLTQNVGKPLRIIHY